jgi:hypothetical protein
MQKEEQIEIPLSKTKLILMVTGSIVFVLLGIWFVSKPKEISSQSFLYSTESIFIAGLAGILFFGICAVFIFRKTADNKPGLIINEKGIIDNSGATSIGLILWQDMLEVRRENVARQDFIVIVVANPEEYINRQSSFIPKKAMEMNYRVYGSPINISANGLKYNFNDLYEIILKKFNTQKRQSTSQV